MASLKDYPYKFNNEEILYPIAWSESFSTIESINQSEAGTDIINVVRYKKLSVSASFKVTNTWLKKFEDYADVDTFTLKRYDGSINGYDERTVRMRNFASNRVQHSEDLTSTVGIWEVSFTLEEI